MASLPRPLLALLVAVLALAGVWMVVLRPSSSASNSAGSPAVSQAYQAAVAARGSGGAKTTPASSRSSSGSRSAAASGSSRARLSTSAASAHSATSAEPATHLTRHTGRAAVAAPGARHTATAVSAHARAARTPARAHAKPAFTQPATPTGRVQALTAALAADKVVALLFYNPAGSDDMADEDLLEQIPADHGRVVRLSVPINEIARYSVVTDHVPVTGSPTLVVIDGHHRARTLVGFADQLEFDQFVSSALAAG